MAVRGFLNYARLAFFSKESSDRQLFRLIKKQQTCRIVELGISSLETTIEVLQLASENSSHTKVQYSGFDLFEERTPDQEPLSLLETHRALSQCEAAIRLTPGCHSDGLPQMANSLPDTDLVLISDSVTDSELDPVWFYMPRMCHPGTLVLRKTEANQDSEEVANWQAIPLSEVERLAAKDISRLAA